MAQDREGVRLVLVPGTGEDDGDVGVVDRDERHRGRDDAAEEGCQRLGG